MNKPIIYQNKKYYPLKLLNKIMSYRSMSRWRKEGWIHNIKINGHFYVPKDSVIKLAKYKYQIPMFSTYLRMCGRYGRKPVGFEAYVSFFNTWLFITERLYLINDTRRIGHAMRRKYPYLKKYRRERV